MLKISIKEYQNSYLKYEGYKKLMDTVETDMLSSIRKMDPYWTGKPKTNFVNDIDSQFSSKGDFFKTKKLFDDVASTMKEHYAELTEIAYRIDNMGDHLTRDEDMSLDSSKAFGDLEPDTYNSGKIYLDESAISIFDANVSDTIAYAQKAKKKYLEAIEEVSGIVNLSESETDVENAYKTLLRIGNFKKEMDLIVKKTDAFSMDFNTKCNALFVNNGGINITYDIPNNVVVTKETIQMLDRIVKKYGRETCMEVIALLKTNEDQTQYAFESLMGRTDLTDAQVKAICILYDEAFKAMEDCTSPETCPTMIDIAQRMTASLFIDGLVKDKTDYEYPKEYQGVVANEELIKRMLCKTENESARCLLKQVQGIEVETNLSWFANIFHTSDVDVSKYAKAGVGFCFTDLGIKTYIQIYPGAERREKYQDEGVFFLRESGFEKLSFVDKCVLTDYKMTIDEEKQAEKITREYFSRSENEFAYDVMENFGMNYLEKSYKYENESAERIEEIKKMYYLDKKCDDGLAFSQGLSQGFILTKPFAYNGILDRKFGDKSDPSGVRATIDASVYQNAISFRAGNFTGEVASQFLVGEAFAGAKVFGAAGNAVAKATGGRIGAEFASNVLAGTAVDTMVDTVPAMIEAGTTEGVKPIEVVGVGAKSLGVNFLYNTGGELISTGVRSFRKANVPEVSFKGGSYDNLDKILKEYDLSSEEFVNLARKPQHSLNDEYRDMMFKIRMELTADVTDANGLVKPGTPLCKAIDAESFAKYYTEGSNATVRGCVALKRDTDALADAADIVNSTGLIFDGSKFVDGTTPRVFYQIDGKLMADQTDVVVRISATTDAVTLSDTVADSFNAKYPDYKYNGYSVFDNSSANDTYLNEIWTRKSKEQVSELSRLTGVSEDNIVLEEAKSYNRVNNPDLGNGITLNQGNPNTLGIPEFYCTKGSVGIAQGTIYRIDGSSKVPVAKINKFGKVHLLEQ